MTNIILVPCPTANRINLLRKIFIYNIYFAKHVIREVNQEPKKLSSRGSSYLIPQFSSYIKKIKVMTS